MRAPLQFLLKEKGMSLMELTLMIAVGAILTLGIGRSIQNQIASAIDIRNYMVAMNLGKQQMAIMNNAAYPALGTTTPASDASYPNFTFSQVVTSVAISGGNNIRQIQMDVLIGSDVIIRLYTYRTNTGVFGDGL